MHGGLSSPHETNANRHLASSLFWRGINDEQGVALVDCLGTGLIPIIMDCALTTAIATRVQGSTPFVCVNLWAQPTPNYKTFVGSVLSELKRMVQRTDHLVIVGDFNSSPVFAAPRKGHIALMSDHAPFGRELHPTYYWLWNGLLAHEQSSLDAARIR